MKKTLTYKGVSYKKREGKWTSSISVKGVRHECGYYDEEILAAKARDMTIIKLGLDRKLLQVLKPIGDTGKNT